MTSRGRATFTAAALSIAACSSSKSGQTVGGTLGGATLNVESAFALMNGEGSALINVVNVAGGCALVGDIGAAVNVRNVQALQLSISSTSALAPGTFAVGATPISGPATASYVATDSNCATTDFEEAISGSITISEVSSSAITGTFDLSMTRNISSHAGPTDHVSGPFSASFCASGNGGTDGGAAGSAQTCM